MKFFVSISTLAMALIVGVALSSCGGKTGGGGKKDGGGGGGGICANPDDHPFCQGICCGAACVNEKTDPDNCGSCGTQCKPGQGCTNGKCGCGSNGATCSATQACCATGCSVVDTDARNCGGCDNQCADNEICVGGQCVCGTASSNTTCTSGQMCCVDPGGNSSTCLADCSTGSVPDGGVPGGDCVCSTPCFAGCFGPECCGEYLIAGLCEPATDCNPVF